MRGRPLMIGLIAFTALFAAALYYAQVFAWYERSSGVGALRVGSEVVPIADYQGIDATSSPLKLRGCFRADPASFAAATPAPEAEPLTAPFWFRCFDARTIGADLAAGRATALALEYDTPPGFDVVVALYPDGRGYLWRRLNARYTD